MPRNASAEWWGDQRGRAPERSRSKTRPTRSARSTFDRSAGSSTRAHVAEDSNSQYLSVELSGFSVRCVASVGLTVLLDNSDSIPSWSV